MCLQPGGCSITRQKITPRRLIDSQGRAYVLINVAKKLFYTEAEQRQRASAQRARATGLKQLNLAASLPYVISKVSIQRINNPAFVYEQNFACTPAKTRLLKHNVVVKEFVINLQYERTRA